MNGRSLRVAGLNLRAGGANRAPAILAAVKRLRADVLVLGEAYPTGHSQVVLDALRAAGFDRQLTAEGDVPQYPSGVAITSRVPFDGGAQPLSGPNRHRLLEMRVGGLLLVGGYFPVGKALVAFYREELLPYAEAHLAEPALLIGDWNSGQPFLDQPDKALPASREFMQLAEMGWVDAWRSRNPATGEFSWYSLKPHLKGFRIDHAFVSPVLAPRVLDVRYDHTPRETRATDHAAIVVDLADAT